RTNFGVRLLPAAEEVIRSLKIIKQENDRLRQISDSMTQSETGTVRIGSFISFAMTHLPQIIKEFQTLHPHIKFNIFTGNQKEIQEQLASGKIDIAFTSKYGSGAFIAQEILKDELVAVLPLDHELATQISIPIQEIQQQTYICSGEKFEFEIGDMLRANHITPKHTFEIFDELLALKLIEAGFGVSIFSKFFLDSIPNHAKVAIRPFKEHYYRSLVLVQNPEQYTSAASTLFKNFTEDWLELLRKS
ncbi:LysR family transcriptional regulator substrate-binding protein, partial [Streptococcus merionis]|uniref:LysR family transcriptional regulator substrate-binding protein n=1 Tax=Streptococcus merionis TaxID=400065 RepID=UPI0026EEFB01